MMACGEEKTYALSAGQVRYLAVKYALDRVLAALLAVLLALPMGAIALGLKLTSPHEPVLFRHQRIGQGGRPFQLIKFRTMGADTSQYVASADMPDSRAHTTGFGRFLRSTSLDELPQLYLVLTGKMSLIGPRPLIPQEREIHALREASGVYRLRPGLTGWAQVNGRDRLSGPEKAALDREYLENIGFALDWKIFWMTVWKVLARSDVQTEAK